MSSPAAPPGRAVPVRHSLVLAIAAVAAVVLIAYLHTLGYPFHFDDLHRLRDNPVLRPPADPWAVIRYWPGRAVPMLSFAAQIAWGQSSLEALRAFNLLIHGAASLLVGWIAAELWRQGLGTERIRAEWVGLIAALLFAAHPLGTQAITYLIQRITSLTALVELVVVAAYLRARRGGAGWWWVSWGSALLAALGKEMVVALPAMIAAIEWALRGARPEVRAPVSKLAPYLLVLPVVAWLAMAPAGPDAAAGRGLRDTPFISRGEYALTQLTVIPRYLALAAWPAHQQLDPQVVIRRGIDLPVVSGAAFLAALVGLAWWLYRRALLASLGLAWFLIALLPESSVFPIRHPMVEHRAYLPLAGLAWAAAAGLSSLAARGRAWLVAPLAVVIALTAVTHVRNRAWASELALWSDNANKSPGSPTAQTNLGLALQEAGRLAEAEAAFRAALRADPGMVLALSNLGVLYGSQRRLGEARIVLERAERLDPRHADALNNLGMLDWIEGDTTSAAARFERAIAADPASPWGRNNLERMRAGRPAP